MQAMDSPWWPRASSPSTFFTNIDARHPSVWEYPASCVRGSRTSHPCPPTAHACNPTRPMCCTPQCQVPQLMPLVAPPLQFMFVTDQLASAHAQHHIERKQNRQPVPAAWTIQNLPWTTPMKNSHGLTSAFQETSSIKFSCSVCQAGADSPLPTLVHNQAQKQPLSRLQ